MEVFISPSINKEEKASLELKLKQLHKNVVFNNKITKDVQLRIVSKLELFLFLNTKWLTITPCCLHHMTQLKIDPFSFVGKEWKFFSNLFLYNKKLGFISMCKDEVKRMSAAVKSMGGNVCDIHDAKIDYLISGSYSKINIDTNAPIVHQSWIEALLHSNTYFSHNKFCIESIRSNNEEVKRKENIRDFSIIYKNEEIRRKENTRDFSIRFNNEEIRRKENTRDFSIIYKNEEDRRKENTWKYNESEEIERRERVKKIVELDDYSDSEPVFLDSKNVSCISQKEDGNNFKCL